MNLIPLLLLSFSSLDTITLTARNHISIKGTIDSYTSSTFINDIEKINKTTIYIYIDSTGGSVHFGEKIIQYMEYKKHRNTTLICIAHHAYSMAFHIYQHCNYRTVVPSSTIMQHQMSLKMDGQLENINNYIQLLNTINAKLIQMESTRLNITSIEYTQKIMNDWWLYGNDIVRNKVADFMIKGIGCHKELMADNSKAVSDSTLVILSKCPLV
jgi:ATP-dependent protease ClpP protease subunit